MKFTSSSHAPRDRAKLVYRFIFLTVLFALGLSAQNKAIIQNPGANYLQDVEQLESDSIQAFLSAHNLPSTDSALLYQYGRQDLRDELRAWIFSNLENIIATPASSRTTHEQNLYNWLEAMVYQNEVAEYSAAVAEYKNFLANKCGYKLDGTIAMQYNLSYNGNAYCILNNFSALLIAPPLPDPQYFLAVGLKSSYNQTLAAYPNSAVILAETATFNEANLAYAIVPAAAGTAVTAALYGTGVLAPYAIRGIVGIGARYLTLTTDEVDLAIDSAEEGGPVGAVLAVAAIIGIQAGVEDQTAAQSQAGLTAMTTYYNSLIQNCNNIDLNAFLTDSSGIGLYKLLSTFTATTLPDVPSTVALPTRTAGVDPIWGNNTPNGATYNQISYTDWNGNNWYASLWGNYLLQTRQDGSSTSFGVTLKINSSAGLCVASGCSQGTLFSASRIGPNWLLIPQTANAAAQPCLVTTGSPISAPGSSLTNCQSYLSSYLQFEQGGLVFGSGASQTTWSVLTPPVFNTSGVGRFIDGTPQTIVLSAGENNSAYAGQTGLYSLAGALPTGFSTQVNPSNVMLRYSGTPAATLPGTYNFTAAAQFGANGTGLSPYVTGTTPLALTVIPGDSIQVRSNTLNAYVGDTVNYQISAAGGGNVLFTLPGITLPPGLTFTERGNVASIAGVATAPGLSSGTIQTNYGATNPLTVDVTYRQPPPFTNPSQWTFTDNVANQFQVQLAPPTTFTVAPNLYISSAPFPPGFVASVNTLAGAAQPLVNAPWLQFQDRHNGTALLSGTPPSSAADTIVYLAAVVPNSLPSFQTLNLLSSSQPVVTGPDVIVAQTPVVNTTGVTTTAIVLPLPVQNIDLTQLTVDTSVPLIIQNNQVVLLPGVVPGLLGVNTYVSGTGTGCSETSVPASVPQVRLASRAATASPATATLASVVPAATLGSNTLVPFHTFNIEIDAAPSITSVARTYFSEGVPNTFYVATGGFPEATTVNNSTSSATAMRVTLSGILPQGLTFTDLSPAGLPTGTGILSGTPTQSGTFPLTFVANNGVGSPATQQFTLTVNAAGDVNGDGVVNCADIAIVKAAFGSTLQQASYDPRADLNHDFIVNILDLSFVAAHLPAGTRCQ